MKSLSLKTILKETTFPWQKDYPDYARPQPQDDGPKKLPRNLQYKKRTYVLGLFKKHGEASYYCGEGKPTSGNIDNALVFKETEVGQCHKLYRHFFQTDKTSNPRIIEMDTTYRYFQDYN